MHSTERGVRKESDYYIYTASSQGMKAYFYPVFLGNFYYDPGYTLSRSSFDSYLLFLVKGGKCTVTANGQTYQVREGQIVYLNCYLPHAYETTTGYNAEWIHFDGPLASVFYEMIVGKGSPIIDLKATYRFSKYLDKLYCSFRDKLPAKEALYNNWITNMLTELLVTKDSTRADTVSTEVTEDLVNYINDHLTDELPLELLASKVSLSPFHFTRLFKKETGFTPHEYVITARINSAKFLLKSTNESIKEICFKTGFSNESSFCTSFKKKVGATPSDYRNEISKFL
ncbi:MAG: AraC family transcriptional regulator [Lachnospiraceae bacterium]|nr:AraC family transcriptional regulator [Lachnospiraceae bacterium]